VFPPVGVPSGFRVFIYQLALLIDGAVDRWTRLRGLVGVGGKGGPGVVGQWLSSLMVVDAVSGV